MAAAEIPDAPPSRATILVVDDERGPRESLRMILEPVHRVLLASGGAAALEILRREPIDLVTLDLNMPGMPGSEVMHTIADEFPQVEIIVITGCGTLESAADGVRLGISDYLAKPFDVVQVGAAISRALLRRHSRLRLGGFLDELGTVLGREQDVQRMLEDMAHSERLRGRVRGMLRERGAEPRPEIAVVPPRTVEFLEVLAETIETKDRFMRGHARRVSLYASLLAERLSLSAAELEQVRFAAFLHDLGKVGVPTELLLREGALDSSERTVVEQHPEIGARLVQPLDIPAAISLAIRHHHEWWDGSGYPDGLAGEEIPLTARVVGIADAFDAMTCDRPYRRALRRQVVLSEFERYAGIQFDPELSKEFLAVIESSLPDLDPEILADVVTAPPARGPREARA